MIRLRVAASLVIASVIGLGFGGACGSSEEKPGSVDPFAFGGSGGKDASADTGGASGSGGVGGSAGDGGAAGNATAGNGGSAGVAGLAGASGSAGALDAAADVQGDAEQDANDGAVPDAGPPAHCSNGFQDAIEGETDLDCGGPCSACVTGQFCQIANDCESLRCDQSTRRCLAAMCNDGVKNGSETDRDCGGSCPSCSDGADCLVNADCRSVVCSGTPKTCQVPTCMDGVKNGLESDIDCGLACNPTKCERGERCVANADCLTNSCSFANTCICPPGMVIVAQPGGGNYCMDDREVTYREYDQFVQASVPTGTQPSTCGWNATFIPSNAWPPLTVALDHPVGFVDWCDAVAYCKWAGRRLCGAIGGGAVPFADFADFTKSQWHNACSAQAQNDYPYGDSYTVQRCNGGEALVLSDGGTVPAPGTTLSTTRPHDCQGGATGLFDMSGNVSEWTDSCEGATDETDRCRMRGGNFTSVSADLRCDAPASGRRDTKQGTLGFRCCLD